MPLTKAFPGVIGIDEVGRGPLAGPVVACAFVCLSDGLELTVADSKSLSAKARALIVDKLETSRLQGLCDWAIAEIDAPEIDRINILAASMLAMKRACEALLAKGHACNEAWVDGNRAPALPVRTHTLVKGDSLRQDIAAASILAKQWRDALMTRLHEQHPHYGWAKNAGYGTALHLQGLAQHGVTPYHRHSFAPVRLAAQTHEAA
jgi:ribonuclease HII